MTKQPGHSYRICACLRFGAERLDAESGLRSMHMGAFPGTVES